MKAKAKAEEMTREQLRYESAALCLMNELAEAADRCGWAFHDDGESNAWELLEAVGDLLEETEMLFPAKVSALVRMLAHYRAWAQANGTQRGNGLRVGVRRLRQHDERPPQTRLGGGGSGSLNPDTLNPGKRKGGVIVNAVLPETLRPGGQYGASAAAAALGVSERTLRRWVARGFLKKRVHKFTGKALFRGDDLIAFWHAVRNA